MWDATGFYEPQTSEPATSDADGSAWLPTPQAQESDPTDQLISEMSEAGLDPQARLYLPGRKWHTQRTLRRTISQLPKQQTPTEDPTSPVRTVETVTVREGMI